MDLLTAQDTVLLGRSVAQYDLQEEDCEVVQRLDPGAYLTGDVTSHDLRRSPISITSGVHEDGI